MRKNVRLCPFCGGNDMYHFRAEGNSHFIRCMTCGAQTAFYPTPGAAVEAWNRRARYSTQVKVPLLRNVESGSEEERE